MSLTFRSGVLSTAGYVPDWSGVDRRPLIRLDRNEATRPLSPALAQALREYITVHGVHSYPDVDDLSAAIADYCGVPGPAVLPTNGSDQAISLCLSAFLRAGDTMLVARPEFAMFGVAAGLLEVAIRGVPYGPDLAFPYADFRAALDPRPDLIVLINPNNPTGTPVEVSFIEEVAARHPEVPVLVDEAYFEFTGSTVVGLLDRYPNLIVLRTFSKAFGLAGLRLGYVVARPEVIAELAKLRNPFDINTLAALAARTQLSRLDDVWEYVRETMTVVKPMTVRFFQQRSVPIWPGAANFVVIRPDNPAQTVAGFREAGILVKPLGGPLLAGSIRMSLGTGAEMAQVFDVYAKLQS
jgi:histidinol-phosphate aminotransferase